MAQGQPTRQRNTKHANQARLNNAVSYLQKHGLHIRATRLGVTRPIIEIERPIGIWQGSAITITQAGKTTQLIVNRVAGCLITWER